MKGFELVKRVYRWDLYNEDGHKIASTLDGCLNKLSTKNCQAIEQKSLQQTEWDVEIEMENAFESYRDGTIEPLDIPKLDIDGCLILKLKSE